MPIRHDHTLLTTTHAALAIGATLAACGGAEPRLASQQQPVAERRPVASETARGGADEPDAVYEQIEETIARHDVADLGPDATLCTLLDSGMVMQLAPFEGAVGLLVVTEETRTEELRRRAHRFAEIARTIAVAPDPELDEDMTARQALVGRAQEEPTRVPTAGSDEEPQPPVAVHRVPVEVTVQKAEGGVMLLFEPDDPTEIGELTLQIRHTSERVQRGECDDAEAS